MHLKRDTIIKPNVIQVQQDKSKVMVPFTFRALGIFTKRHNKWHMTENKIIWKPGDAKENKKKYRVAMRIVHEKIHKPYEDYIISHKTCYEHEHRHVEMVRVIEGNDIADVTDRFFIY